MAIKASTVITLIRVDDGTGYTILLSNEAYAFAAGVSAAVAGSTSTDVMAHKNTTQVAATVTKIGSTNVSGNQTGVATGVTGLAAAVTGNGTTACRITFSATTALTTKSGNVPIIVSVDGKSYTKQFSFSLALTGTPGKDGEDGVDGRGIEGTTISYQSSTSGTTIPTGAWTLTIPSVAAGQYLWTRTVITYTDNTSSTSYSVGKMGSTGAQGNPTGVIVSATEPTGKYAGMLWQHTGTVAGLVKNATYRWTGSSWALWKLTATNLDVTNLAAINANLGNVTAGSLTLKWEYKQATSGGPLYKGTTYVGPKYQNNYPSIYYDWEMYNGVTGAFESSGQSQYGPFGVLMTDSKVTAGAPVVLNASLLKLLESVPTTINNLSNRFNNTDVVRTWKGNFANPAFTSCTVPAHIVGKVYNNGKNADIQISCYFELWKPPGGSNYKIFNENALKSVCGGKKVTIEPEKSTVTLFQQGSNPVDNNFFGRTGLAFHAVPGGSIEFSRCYNAALNFGGWGTEISLYGQGRFAIINVIGAVLT